MINQHPRPLWWRRVGAALLLVAVVVLFFRFRPQLPLLPDSLSAPLTIETVQAAARWLLWILLLLLAVAFLRRTLRAAGRQEAAVRSRLVWPSKQPVRSVRIHSRAAAPLLVIADPDRRASGLSQARQGLRDGEFGEQTPRSERATQACIRVCVLGPLKIEGARQTRRGLRAAAFELIAYLALNRRAVQRDELLEAFWPGRDPKRTRHRLYQAVHDARRLLGGALASERDRYWLDRRVVSVDVDDLERLLAAAGRAADSKDEQRLLERALALFADEPLAGADYAWTEGELRRLRAIYVGLLERLGRLRLDGGELHAALEAAERGLAVDPLNEGLWRLALEAEGALGLREAVTQRYERLRSLLQQRVGLEPARETRLLHRQLLGQH